MDGIAINITSIYKNQKSRDKVYFELLCRSIDFIKRAICVNEFIILKKYISDINYNSVKQLERFADEDLFDSIKITMCFENYLKGLLIKRGYIIHEIDQKGFNGKFKALGNINKTPVKISDYKKIEGYVYQQQTKYMELQGLKARTIQLSALLKKPAYIRILNLPSKVIDSIKNYSERRNVLHLKLFGGNYLHSNKIKDLEILLDYVNKYLIRRYNNHLVRTNKGKDISNILIQKINVA